MPRQPPYCPSAAPDYWQPVYPPSNQHYSMPVQVGIPAGPSLFGSVAQQAVAPVGHVGNGEMGEGHAGNAVLGGTNGQRNFVQGTFVQDKASVNNGTSSESPPQLMSFPPGFEPAYNKAAQPSQQQHQYHYQNRPQFQQQHRLQHQSQQQHYPQPQHQRQFQHQPQPQHQHQQPHHQLQQHEHSQNQHPDHPQLHYTQQQPFPHSQQNFHPHNQVQPQGQPHTQYQPQRPLQPQHPTQQSQAPLQPQPQHQHQMHQLQPPLQPHHQHKMQQPQPLLQPQPQHLHQLQQSQPPQPLHQLQQPQPPLQPQSQHHHQMQQPRPPLQPQPEHDHHMQQQPPLQAQSQHQHQMQQPRPPLQPQHQYQMQQPQPPLQSQTACQQAQPAQFIPFAKAQSQLCPSNVEACPVNGIAIGVHVMGRPHANASCAMQPAKMGLTQEHSRTRQASQPECPPTSQSSQCSMSHINSEKHLKGAHPPVTASPLPDRDLCSNDCQPSNNNKFIQSQSGPSTDPTRSNTVNPHTSAEKEHMSSPKAEMQLCTENRKLPISQAESMGNLTTFGPSPFSRSRYCNQDTHKGPLRSGENWQRWSSTTTRDNQSPFKGHMRNPSKIRYGCGKALGKAQRNNVEALQWQRPREFRGKFLGKETGGWSSKQPLWCEPCDRVFTGYEDLNAHLTSHVKCDEEGCTFEAAGKLVKEHKVVKHGKISVQATARGRRALALRSAEDEEDIKRWREERKNSYPTASNMLRKEEGKKTEGEGGSLGEEALKRRERMIEVIAKQRKLGFQAPEIPSNYFRVPYNNRRPRNGRVDKSTEQDMVKEQTNGTDREGVKESRVGQKRACPTEVGSVAMEVVERAKEKTMEEIPSKVDGKEPLHGSACDNRLYDNSPSKKGDAVRKGARKKRLPWQKRHKYDATDKQQQQQPTLLSRLLQNDVQREESHLLQCCRFFVNNAFLQEDCSPASLKHFKCIQMTLASAAESTGPLCNDVMDAMDEEDSKDFLSDSEEEASRPFHRTSADVAVTSY